MTASVLLPALTATARRAAHPGQGPCACPAAGTVLADRADGTVVRHGDIVAKAHAPGTDPAELGARLAAAAALPGILLPPLAPVAADLDDRLVTVWPHGSPVDPDAPEHAPWEEAATLLARLHAVPTAELPGPLPPMRGPAKAALAVTRLLAMRPSPGVLPDPARLVGPAALGPRREPRPARVGAVPRRPAPRPARPPPRQDRPLAPDRCRRPRHRRPGLGPRPPCRVVRVRPASRTGVDEVPHRVPGGGRRSVAPGRPVVHPRRPGPRPHRPDRGACRGQGRRGRPGARRGGGGHGRRL